MSFTPLVDAWHEGEETRSRLRPGRRWYRMEKALGEGVGLADMTRNRHHWRFHETSDGLARPRELWAWYPAPDEAAADDRADDEAGWDTELVDGFADEFNGEPADEPNDEAGPEDAPARLDRSTQARHCVDQARDTVHRRTGEVAAHDDGDPVGEARREQLARWHSDDHTAETAGAESGDADEAGWSA